LTKKHGLPFQILQVVDDRHGHLWLSTGRGLLRAKLSDLNAAADGIRQQVPLTAFTRADGLRSNDCVGGAQPGVLRSSDGRLWIPTAKGVSVVDPGAKTRPSWHAPITVTNVRIDGLSVPQSERITVPAGAKRLLIQMIAPTFIAPEEAEYEYKLDGFDSRWIATNPKGIAQFTQLRGGDYALSARMRRRGDEPWIQLATPLAIHVQTPFYRSLPFYVLLALTAVVLASLLQRMRLRRLSRRYALILGERIRIARDVHDALSQDFFAIRLQLTAVAQAMQDSSAEANRHLGKAIELTRHANEEARRIVHGLHDAANERATLADALRGIVAEMRAGVSEGIDLSIHDGDHLPPRIETTLLPIAREALTNAVRHAHASRIVVEVHRSGRTVRLRIADNGIGVGPEALNAPAHHVGIRSMRERVAKIGGKIEFRTAPESGTEVVVAVKVPFFSWLRAQLLAKPV
jgi:signal transduction histidine kinase